MKILKISKRLQLGKLATPLPDRKRPVYRWFQLHESFSSGLVRMLADLWGLGKGDLVLDPFSGAGTTPLACKELGIDCIGYEAHPVFLFVSKVKLREYSPVELHHAAEKIVRSKFEPVEEKVPGFVERIFPKSLLREVIFLRREISRIEREEVRDSLMLGLAGALFLGPFRRDGAAVKPRISPTPFRETFRWVLHQMVSDVEKFERKECDVGVERGDSRKLGLGDSAVDAVITSPPYLQKPEYSRAYAVEQWLLGLEGPKPDGLAGVRPEGSPPEDFSEISPLENDSQETKLYFKDMLAVARELHRVCRPGARVAVVVSDGCSREGVVEVCVRLSDLAAKAGFRPKQVVAVNERWCTTPSRRKLGTAKESILLWEKRD